MEGSDPVQSTKGGSLAEDFTVHLVSSRARRLRVGEELADRSEESIATLSLRSL